MILEWALINIIVPIALPMLGLWLVSWAMPLTDSQRKKTKPLVTVRDGQLGWLAVAWAAAALSGNKYRYLIGSTAVTVMSASAWGFIHVAIQ